MNTKELETTDKAVRYNRPLGRISEEEDGVVLLRLEMPGVPKEGLTIDIDGDLLIVTGARTEQPDSGRYLVRERPRNNFGRTYTLDETVDRNRIEAELSNGVLTVSLHLKEEVKPRKIEVKGR